MLLAQAELGSWQWPSLVMTKAPKATGITGGPLGTTPHAATAPGPSTLPTGEPRTQCLVEIVLAFFEYSGTPVSADLVTMVFHSKSVVYCGLKMLSGFVKK